MRHLGLVCCAAALVGCSGSGEHAADSSAVAPAAAAPPATIALADVAGKWALRSTDAAGGSPTESELTATADTLWTWKLANGSTVNVRVVAVGGDTIVTEAGPYESVLRPGIQTRNRTVYRLREGKLIGTIEARYALPRGDSVAQRRSEGTRVP